MNRIVTVIRPLNCAWMVQGVARKWQCAIIRSHKRRVDKGLQCTINLSYLPKYVGTTYMYSCCNISQFETHAAISLDKDILVH